jgi:hypothetical protein
MTARKRRKSRRKPVEVFAGRKPGTLIIHAPSKPLLWSAVELQGPWYVKADLKAALLGRTNEQSYTLAQDYFDERRAARSHDLDIIKLCIRPKGASLDELRKVIGPVRALQTVSAVAKRCGFRVDTIKTPGEKVRYRLLLPRH